MFLYVYYIYIYIIYISIIYCYYLLINLHSIAFLTSLLLLTLQTVQRNCANLLRLDGPHCLLVDLILRLDAPGHAEAVASVTQFVADEPSVMEHPSIHRVLKSLVRCEFQDFLFARSLLGHLKGSLAVHAKVNRCAFVVLSLLECGSADVATAVRAELTPALPALQKLQNVAGTALLVQVLCDLYFESEQAG